MLLFVAHIPADFGSDKLNEPDAAISALFALLDRRNRAGAPVHEEAPAAIVAGSKMIFRDRAEAGQLLAAEIAGLELADPVVLALPRGGIPVGRARSLLPCPVAPPDTIESSVINSQAAEISVFSVVDQVSAFAML